MIDSQFFRGILMVPLAPSILAMLLSVTVIFSDTCMRRVPNLWLLAALLVGTLALALPDGWVASGHWATPWIGLLAGFLVLLPMYACGWMGAGDVKFFATLGFLLGARALLPIWVIGSLLCGVHALLVVMARAPMVQMLPGWNTVQLRYADSAWAQRLARARGNRQGLPYAAYLGIGALITLAMPQLAHW